MSAITYQSGNFFFSPLPLVSLSFKTSDRERLKFHCLCIYSLWSRDYWLYKVIQTDEWILYWLKCKYGLILGCSHTATEYKQLSSLSFIVSQRSNSVFLKLLIKMLPPPSGSGDLGKWNSRKWDVDIDCTIWNRGHLSVYIKLSCRHIITPFSLHL